jgi:hypothetical protein
LVYRGFRAVNPIDLAGLLGRGRRRNRIGAGEWSVAGGYFCAGWRRRAASMASGVEELVGCTSVGDNPLGGLGYSLRRDGALEWLSAGRGAGPADLVADPANHELPSVIRVGLVGSPRVTRK